MRGSRPRTPRVARPPPRSRRPRRELRAAAASSADPALAVDARRTRGSRAALTRWSVVRMSVAFTTRRRATARTRSSGAEAVDARPQAEVRRRRPLRLEARDALDGLRHGEPVPPEEELTRERRAIQLAKRQRPHGRDDSRRLRLQAFPRRTANRDRPMRILLVVLVLAFAGLLAVDLEPSATSRAAVAVPARVTVPKPAPEDRRRRVRPERLGRPRRAGRPEGRRGRRGRAARAHAGPDEGRATQRNPHGASGRRAPALAARPAPRRGSRASRARRSGRARRRRSACGSGRSPPRSRRTGRRSTRWSRPRGVS